MKILYISHHLRGDDGWSRYARDLISEVKKKGNEVICLVHEADTNTPLQQIKCLTRDPLSDLLSPLKSYFDAQRVNKIIKDFKPDVIHIIVEPYTTMIPFLDKSHSKIIVTLHGSLSFIPALLSGFKKMYANYITKLTYRKIDFVIAVSNYTTHYVEEKLGSIGMKNSKHKICVISGGISEDSISKSSDKSINFKKEILFVGALKPRKGLIEAIEALSFVTSDFIFRIVGKYNPGDGYTKELKKKIEERNLGEKVQFVGSVSDEKLNEMYNVADLFLMLSINSKRDFEGYGLVYIEANGRGVPVIGPNDSGATDAIVNEKTGYTVDPHSPQEVARVIDNLLLNKTIKSSDCREWAYKNRNEIKAQEVVNVYTQSVSIMI